MLQIKDNRRLSAYAARYQLDNVFSCWDQLQKELVFYEKKEYISRLGSPMPSLFFLVEGSVRLTTPEQNGSSLSITTFTGYAIFGDVEYLLRVPSASDMQALTDVWCIQIPDTPNRRLLDEDICFYRYLSKTLAQRMTLVNNITIQKSSCPLEQRLAEYLLERYSDTQEPISNLKPMCDSLHCSYRQLLRIFKQFCKNGCLRHGEKRGTYFIEEGLYEYKHVCNL